METSNRNQQETASQPQYSNKREIWGAVGMILSFYIVAIIISTAVPEENFKIQFVLMMLPAVATIIYGYLAAVKENYLILRIVFILLLVFVVLEWASRIFLRI